MGGVNLPPATKQGQVNTAATVAIGKGGSTTVTPAQPIDLSGLTVMKSTVLSQGSSKSRSYENGKAVPGQKAVVSYVADGDTANLKTSDGNVLNCRVDGIDSPETAKPKHGKGGQKYGKEAGEALKKMIERKEVTVRVVEGVQQGGSNYGRSVCQIEFEGKDVSAEMVRQGAAWVYDHYSVSSKLGQYQADAQRNKAGLWKDNNPMNPVTFKQIQRSNPGFTDIGR